MTEAPCANCLHPGCHDLAPFGSHYCQRHKRDETPIRRKPDKRESSSKRGYDRRWEHLRLQFLRAYPLCKACEKEDRFTPAEQVDHIVPLRQGGARLDPSNLQSLCTTCHNSKTAKERWHRG